MGFELQPKKIAKIEDLLGRKGYKEPSMHTPVATSAYKPYQGQSATEILNNFKQQKSNSSQYINGFSDYYDDYLKSQKRIKTSDALNRYDSMKNQHDKLLNQGYKPSDKVNSALNNANKWAGTIENMPDFEYKPKYTGKIEGLLDKYENNKFSYDINNDPLYQQLAENFQQKGKQAMLDTMGQASAMTGGYGSSYAQSVGQQAYQQNLNELNNVVPELHQMAYQQYSDTQQRTINLAGFYQDMDNGNFEKALSTYQTNLSRYSEMLDYYQSQYQHMDSAERNQYATMLDGYYKSMNQAYQAYDGAMGQDNYENSMKQSIAQSKADQADKENSYVWEMAKQMAAQANSDREYNYNLQMYQLQQQQAAEKEASKTAEEDAKLKGSYGTPKNAASAKKTVGMMVSQGESKTAIRNQLQNWYTSEKITEKELQQLFLTAGF